VAFFTDFFYDKINYFAYSSFRGDVTKMGLWKKICFCSLPLVLLSLSGCCRVLLQKDLRPYRIITQVSVVYENGALSAQRDFYREESIRHILDYLRYVDPYGIPREDPELATGRCYSITLIYSDGSQRLYEQRADQYMRIDGGDWMRIEPQKALYLSGLFSMMPSDASITDAGPVPPLIRPQI